MPQKKYTQAYASVRLTSGDLNPSEVTKALLIPPDHTHCAGEPRLERSRGGQVVRYADYREGQWSFSSQSWVTGNRLATHVAWLIDQLEPKAQELAALLATGVVGDIFCFSYGETPSPPSVPRALRERAGALGLRIDVDHYEPKASESPGDG